MTATLQVLVEERSAKAALDILLPSLVPNQPFEIHPFNGKGDLLGKLENRLRGYLHWPEPVAVVVLIDRDTDNCLELKRRLLDAAVGAGMEPHSVVGSKGQVLMRVAVEELEAWFLGDVAALRAAYPRVPASLDQRTNFRDPDAVGGGTWEALERVLCQAGHHRGGLAKVRAAREIAPHMDVEQNRSASFRAFKVGVRSLVQHLGEQ